MLVFGFLYGVRRFEINRREQKAQIRESELRAKAVEAEKRALEAENERKTKELEDARQLQLSMLPKEVPKFPGYEIAVFMKTATEVGGDYYDFSAGEGRTLNVAFGDATGHGMQAGTIVTLMKGLFLSDASRFDIQTFFNHCSRAIKEIKLGRLFMAFTLVRLKGQFTVCFVERRNAPGFPLPKARRSVEEILLKGMPLGAMKNFPYVLHETRWPRATRCCCSPTDCRSRRTAARRCSTTRACSRRSRRRGAERPESIIRTARERRRVLDGRRRSGRRHHAPGHPED